MHQLAPGTRLGHASGVHVRLQPGALLLVPHDTVVRQIVQHLRSERRQGLGG